MELRNGKFYEGKTEIPPQFGNWEQIRLIRAEEIRLKMKEENEPIQVNITAKNTSEETTYYFSINAEFTCSCGNKIKHGVSETESNDDDEYEVAMDFIKDNDYEDITIDCDKCKAEYEFAMDKKELMLIRIK